MPCDQTILKKVPLFSLLDEEEVAVLAAQVELRQYAARQRVYKMGDPGGRAYILVSGNVRVSTVDQDQQEVVVAEPVAGDLFGLASMLEQTPHQTTATALNETTCVEVDRNDISVLLQRKPEAGMDMMAELGRHFHGAHLLVRARSHRNPNEVIEEETTFGQHLADAVARFGGSWSFILAFGAVLVVYTAINVGLGPSAWDPYPFILLNLFLSMLAAIQAPVIMMSQNRQDVKDRLRGELDYDVNRRAASDIQGLARKLNLLGDKVDDLDELLREKLPGFTSATQPPVS